MKKLRGIIFCFLVIFLLTGCGSNGAKTPEDVATSMVELLSSGNYKKASELLYLEDNTFVDEKSFEQFLKSNELIIKDNKKIELAEDGGTSEKDITNKIVKVKIDNNKIFELNTRLKDGKWYVDIGDNNYDKDLVIQVPKGLEVKLNGVPLDKKIAVDEKIDGKVTYNYAYEFESHFDSYKIEKILKGTYKLNVVGDMIDDVNIDINSNRNKYNETDEKNKLFSTKDTSVYRLLPKLNDSESENLDKFLREYYNTLFNEVNKDKDNNCGNLAKYIENTSVIDERFKSLVKSKDQSNSYTIKTNSNFKLNDIEYYYKLRGSYYSDDTIIVFADIKMGYHYNFDYIGFMASQSKYYKEDKDKEEKGKAVIHLKKDKAGYKIVNGAGNLVPYGV